jgi:hypothetical protein
MVVSNEATRNPKEVHIITSGLNFPTESPTLNTMFTVNAATYNAMLAISESLPGLSVSCIRIPPSICIGLYSKLRIKYQKTLKIAT